MKILFTGSSSFTGMWFVEELAKSGHQVVAVFQQASDGYTAVRGERVKRIAAHAKTVYCCPFGSPEFINLINDDGPWDLFCHHAADVTNYKSADFNATSALANNVYQLRPVLEALKKQGCNQVVLTGSVFEQNEGTGSDQLRAVSPYGLSKGLTSDYFAYYCSSLEMRLGKFVIPNPFGPYEEKRFTGYLIDNWFRGVTPVVDSPAYVRDNIHVSLLAKAYVDFATHLENRPGFQKINPSGYPESQKFFALLFSREMSKRLGLPCAIEFKEQKLFPEPRVRINTDLLSIEKLKWNETDAWDRLAEYYSQIFGK